MKVVDLGSHGWKWRVGFSAAAGIERRVGESVLNLTHDGGSLANGSDGVKGKEQGGGKIRWQKDLGQKNGEVEISGSLRASRTMAAQSGGPKTGSDEHRSNRRDAKNAERETTTK